MSTKLEHDKLGQDDINGTSNMNSTTCKCFLKTPIFMNKQNIKDSMLNVNYR